ncbi:hypothetical protein, partial [Pseudomonas aeruginosa]
ASRSNQPQIGNAHDMEWVLIMTIEANRGAYVQQYAVPGFQSKKSCEDAGAKLSIAAGQPFRNALSEHKKTERTTGYPVCVEIEKS